MKKPPAKQSPQNKSERVWQTRLGEASMNKKKKKAKKKKKLDPKKLFDYILYSKKSK